MKRKRRVMVLTALVLFMIAGIAGDAAKSRSRQITGEYAAQQAETIAKPVGEKPLSILVSLYDVYDLVVRGREKTPEKAATREPSEEIQEAMQENGELRYESILLDDIPTLEVYRDDGEKKPLVIFLHGLGMNKDSVLPVLTAYAEAGYYAVSIDAFDQGERYSEALNCDNWAAMLLTVSDVDRVVEYYETVEQADTEKFVLGGFSMGGVESWAYAQIGSYPLSAIVTMCGMCEYDVWQSFSQGQLAYSWLRPWKDSVWAFPEMQEQSYTENKMSSISSLNITANLESYENIPIFSCIGTEDFFFNAENAEEVAEAIEDSGNDCVTFIRYENVEHEITQDMITDSVTFLESL